jgi:hypothetical protein
VLNGHVVDGAARVTIELDYPVTPRPRWGHGAPPHPRLEARFDRERERYRDTLGRILEHRDDLVRIPAAAGDDPTQPCWSNGWLPGLDGAALYTFLADTNPRLYLEVGSGNSTKFARRAIADHGLRTQVVSIDPFPRAEIDAICDEIVREPAESVDLSVYERLDAGDVLFVDNSHHCLQNSDATAMFLDVLPELRPGVLVGVHDVFLPDDYPPEWVDRFYSEQYVLAAYLLAPGGRSEVVLPGWFASRDPQLAAVLYDMWERPEFAGVQRHGCAFWLRSVAAD